MALSAGALGPWARGRCAFYSGAALLLLHEFVFLDPRFLNLRDRIFSNDRPTHLASLPDAIQLNKEGIFSLPGYLALYLLALSLFRHVNHSLAARRNGALRSLLPLSAALWGAFWAFDARSRTSRRACNAAFVAWTLAEALVLALIPITAGMRGIEPGPMAASLAKRMLPSFLVANLLTGAVNLAIDTRTVGVPGAWAIVGAYCTAVVLLPTLHGSTAIRISLGQLRRGCGWVGVRTEPGSAWLPAHASRTPPIASRRGRSRSRQPGT